MKKVKIININPRDFGFYGTKRPENRTGPDQGLF